MVVSHFRLKHSYAEFIISYGTLPLITLTARMKDTTYREGLAQLPLNTTALSLIVPQSGALNVKSWLADLEGVVSQQLPQFKTVILLSQAWL